MFLILIKEGVTTMDTKFSKAFLLSGKDFKLTPYITLHHPTVEEILSIDNSSSPDNLYWQYVQILLSDPYSNMVMLDDMGKNYLKVSPYEVFVWQWDNCIKSYQENEQIYNAYGLNPLQNITKALSFFIKEEHSFSKNIYKDGTACFFDINNPVCQINKEIFKFIHEWVKAINHIEYTNRINPADENARRILIEDMRDEIKKKKRKGNSENEDSDFLGNMLSAVSFCENGSITPFNINNCKIYWINESLSINSKKNYTDHILDGIYHGTINSKDISKKELDWMK